MFCRNVGWQIDATFVSREKKIGFWRFPAIMYPKPIRRCAADLCSDEFICFRGERFHGFLVRFQCWRDNDPPARQSVRVNRHADKRTKKGTHTPWSPAC